MTQYYHFNVQKIIRDKRIENMSQSGILVEEKTLLPDEILSFLKEKLLEEAVEVKEAKTRKELIEELADVLEVIDAIKVFNQISLEEIIKEKEAKLEGSGGFIEARFCTTIKVPEGHYLLEYCRKNPSQYPEIKS